jgi:hypothetical protein
MNSAVSDSVNGFLKTISVSHSACARLNSFGTPYFDFQPVLDRAELDGGRRTKTERPTWQAPFTRGPERNDCKWLPVLSLRTPRAEQQRDGQPR